ncbi:hypothetical protein G4D82_08610 [Flavobacterium sp. CYK-4]|uniref:hypothetical protein n=1 Tax=Flavobacterium lotistagni TaxID=2709660 RepID=UPI00140A7AE3|nr:hypothetical protein [Flavobacterium lotistagni]NHM07279.1 hypothetical protein [Flavobacterium lotistagni]
MISTENREKVILFFESIDKYYGCKTEITEGLHIDTPDSDANAATWNMCEFELVRSAYRKQGERFMMEGEKMYYEISAARIIDFKQPKRHTYEFVEQYGVAVFRTTKIRFHSKY